MICGWIQAHASTVRLSLSKGKGEQRLMKVVDAPNLGELSPLNSNREVAWDHDLFRPANLLSSTPCKGGWLYPCASAFCHAKSHAQDRALLLENVNPKRTPEQELGRSMNLEVEAWSLCVLDLAGH